MVSAENIATLFALVALALVLSSIFHDKLGLPLIGELLSGVILGPLVIGLVHPGAATAFFAFYATLIVTFSAGLHIDLKGLKEAASKKGCKLALLPFAVPFFIAAATSFLWGLNSVSSIIIGICLSVTALPVAVEILRSFGILNSKLGHFAVFSSLLEDSLAFLLLGVAIFLYSEGPISLSHFGVLLAFGLGMASKPFIASLKSKASKTARPLANFTERLNSLATTVNKNLAAPILLSVIGLHANWTQAATSPLTWVLFAVAVVTKFGSGFLVGRLLEMPKSTAIGLGIIVNARGLMEIVFAETALRAGLIDQSLYSILVFIGLFTTVMTPVLYRFHVKKTIRPINASTHLALPEIDQR